MSTFDIKLLTWNNRWFKKKFYETNHSNVEKVLLAKINIVTPRYLADARAEFRLWLSPRHPDTPHLCVRDSSGSDAQFILTLGKGYPH